MEKTDFFSKLFQADTLSYKYVNEEYIENSVLKNTNIIGCTIQNSTFFQTNFNSSDFDGTILIDCKLINVDWSRTDSCSLTASNTLLYQL